MLVHDEWDVRSLSYVLRIENVEHQIVVRVRLLLQHLWTPWRRSRLWSNTSCRMGNVYCWSFRRSRQILTARSSLCLDLRRGVHLTRTATRVPHLVFQRFHSQAVKSPEGKFSCVSCPEQLLSSFALGGHSLVPVPALFRRPAFPTARESVAGPQRQTGPVQGYEKSNKNWDGNYPVCAHVLPASVFEVLPSRQLETRLLRNGKLARFEVEGCKEKEVLVF